MQTFLALTKRNIKMFFKDKGLFFTSLITPVILLVLYATFLARVYHDSFVSNIPDYLNVSDKLINGTVGVELFSSLLAVCCVTVAFCSNTLMAQDKLTGARKDFMITPVKKSTLAISYYVATLLTPLIVSYVGTIVSAGYGFICGAYMPISQFSPFLQKAIAFLPGTYGTSLIRNHALNGVYKEMANQFPAEVIEGIKDSIDCNIYLFDNKVSSISTAILYLLS